MPLCNSMSINFCKTKVVIVTCHGPAIELLYHKENSNSGGGGPKEGDLLEDRGVDGRITLRWIFKTWDGGGSGQRQVAGAFECCNELSGSIKCGECLG